MGQLVERQIPTLFGGVSRQPSQTKRPNQVEEMTNALPSVVTGGFEKRPATQHIAALSALDNTKNYAVHEIDRDDTEQLKVYLADGEIVVYDTIAGTQKTVTIGDTKRYFLVEAVNVDATGVMDTSALSDAQGFGWDSSDRFQIKHADTQFDWGWSSSDGTLDFDLEGSADGSVWVDLATGKTGASGTFSTTVDAVATGDHNYIRISIDVAAGTASDTLTLWATFKDKTYLSTDITGPEDYAFVTVADFTFIANRNYVARLKEADSGTVADTARSTAVGTPPAGIVAPTGSGNIYKIIEDGNEFTTYYVIDDTTDNLYVETADPNAHNGFDASSFPHQLVRNADGTFTFQAATYADRGVGDETVTEAPSFINKKIRDVVFFRNRLGFFADENIVLSRSAEALDFWPEKAVTTLDTDPIDRAATTTDINILNWGTVFRKLLFATSNRAQFELSSADAFTPSTANFDQATRYRASDLAKPKAMGDVLYFAAQNNSYAQIFEYYFDEASFSNTAADVSKHIVDYIPNDVLKIVTDPSSGMVFVLTTGEQNSLFVYRTFFDGNQKLQSAWFKYIFGADETKAFIHGMAVFSGFLVLTIERQDGVIYLEQMPIEREAKDVSMGYIPLCDQREVITGTYDSTHDYTYWVPTWKHEDDCEVVLGPNFTGDDVGRRMTLIYPSEYTLTFASVAAAETIIVTDGTVSRTLTAHATTTTAANLEFDISGNDIADAGEFVTVFNDATYGHTTITATDNGDGTVTLLADDEADVTITSPTGTAVTNATVTVAEVDQRIVARGQHDDAAAYVGRQYTKTVELSKLFMREAADDPAIITGRLQIRDITFQHEETGFYTVRVTPRLRSANDFDFTGRTIGDDDNQIGSAPIDDEGDYRAMVGSDGETVKIEVINDTPFPSVITSAAWRGFFNELSRQG